jgi:N-acetylglucosamine-6-phosphate deacetylase
MLRRVFLSGADVVLPDRIERDRTLVLEDGRIVELTAGPRDVGAHEQRVHLPDCVILPGFIDVHVHGVAGHDVQDGPAALGEVAVALPRYGVTAFSPTSIACPPATLDAFLRAVSAARQHRGPRQARVLPAHLESNFISPEYAGAQPAACLRTPASALRERGTARAAGRADDYSGADIRGVIDRHRPDVGIVTLAPELEGGLELVTRLAQGGVAVSMGHSGASFDVAQAAIAAGASQATHLFNRMPAMSHRDPGLAGAVLASDDVAAEVICDGHHVHPAFVRMAVAAKRPARIMAITDGTAGSGLPPGTRTQLGGRPITVAEVARLDDGTMAGSVATMDRVFSCLVGACGIGIREAAEMCATTPARQLGLVGHGIIAAGQVADLVVLDSRFRVVQTWIAGDLAWSGTLDDSPAS